MINSEVNYKYGHRSWVVIGTRSAWLCLGDRAGLQLLGLAATAGTHLPSYLARVPEVLQESLGGGDQCPREPSEPRPLKPEPSGQTERLSLHLDPHLPSSFWGDTGAPRPGAVLVCARTQWWPPRARERQGLGPHARLRGPRQVSSAL